MDDEDAGGQEEPLEPREPVVQDLVELCRLINASGGRYVVIGGFAILNHGYNRRTMDVDLLIETSLENESIVYRALESLPDKAVLELEPGEVAKYIVVRIADEIVVDLMKSACGIEYEEAARDAVIREIGGVPIPFASPETLWRMKKPTGRAKDIPDLLFLEHWFREHGRSPPPID